MFCTLCYRTWFVHNMLTIRHKILWVNWWKNKSLWQWTTFKSSMISRNSKKSFDINNISLSLKLYNPHFNSDNSWHQKSSTWCAVKKTKGNSRYDEEKKGKGCASWPDFKMAFSNLLYIAQYCLLGTLWRPWSLVIKYLNFPAVFLKP